MKTGNVAAEAVQKRPFSSPLTIATFNLYNLFAVPEYGDLGTKLAKLTLAIQVEMLLPDILLVQEVASEALLGQLATAVNAGSACVYQAVAPPSSDRRGIRVGLLWNTARVQLQEAWQLQGADVSAAFGADSFNPGREPLAGLFTWDEQPLLILANHFKSDYVPPAQEEERDHLRRKFEAQRLAQARVVRNFVDDWLARDPQALLLVGGDLNAEPTDLAVRFVAGHPPQIPLVNLLPTLRPGVHTFMRDGQPAILDHLLASPALRARCVDVVVPHFNTGQADGLTAVSTTAR
ncbi:MAG: endonuclease/exonuclease/phosphatase family protein, partial [Anaerolineales bacterium]|nr:endonuclease/exonuclease/phosphatase family protein [Anaerolineales bacterium]